MSEQQSLTFPALHDIELDIAQLVSIKRYELIPLLDQPASLTHYADKIIQKQNQLILSNNIGKSKELSQLIEKIISQLNQSQRYLKPRKFNFLQKWLGIDLEQEVSSMSYLNELHTLLEQAARLSQRLATEIYQSQKNMQTLHEYRIQMAHYVVAAEQFISEAENFAQAHQLDQIKTRLHKKINTLMTSQSATDLAMLQIQLNQNVAMTILDRFNEAKNVLIPAWQQHVLQVQQGSTPQELQKLNDARDKLIQTLDRAVKTNQNSSISSEK